jgi:hypothetical protein
MTRELYAALQKAFPPAEIKGGWRITSKSGGYEWFRVTLLGQEFRKPSLEEIIAIARPTLKRVKRVYIARELTNLEGVEPGDIVIIPGYQSSISSHAIAINDMGFSPQKVYINSSWHGNYHMTSKQIERYIAFAQLYFKTFPKTEEDK